MKSKKKPNQTKSINTIKLLNIKTVQVQKNTTSTNQKTFTTIEENLRTFQNADTEAKRQSLKERFSKKSYVQRMQQNNLSPFSNDGRSASPKYRKTPQKLITPREREVKFAINLKQFQKKKVVKSKANSARESISTPMNNMKKTPINKTFANEQKKKVQQKKKPLKLQKKQKQQKARIQFQNQFLSMMNNRIHKQKITEISEEQLQCSVRRKPKLQILIQSENNSRQQQNKIQHKRQIVRTMRLKIMRNIQRDYPNLHPHEKKVICAVIIVQRLWRQSKVKQFFQHYVTPRASPESSARESLQKELSSNRSTIQLVSNHVSKKSQQSQPQQNIPKKKNTVRVQQSITENPSSMRENNFLIRQHSEESMSETQQLASLQRQSQLNDKVTKLFEDSILSFENQNEKIVYESSSQMDKPSMLKFVQCYREVKLKNTKKNVSKSKRNIFSLKESLSEKCLMQKYYNRIFSDKPEKDKPKNYELFSLNSNTKIVQQTLKLNQQSSIELFKQINQHPDYISPQKMPFRKERSEEYEEEVWVRNETNYSQQTDSDQFIIGKGKQRTKVEKLIVDEIRRADNFGKKNADMANIVIENEEYLEPSKGDKQSELPTEGIVSKYPAATNLTKQYSLKQLQIAADWVMSQLMNEFFKQYIGFQQKQCLVKRKKQKYRQEQKDKKPKLPGIEITHQSITQYLDILIPYILVSDRQQVLRSLQLFHPSTYQKCHRVQSCVYEIFEFGQEEQEEEIYWNIISNQGFFTCLETFWKNNVTLTKEKQSFTNFIDLTYKVYNRCITDAFSQIFNKLALEKITYPWNSLTRGRQLLIFDKDSKAILNQQQIETITYQVKQKLLTQSFCYSTTAGRLIKKQRKQKKKVKEYEFGQQPQQQQLMIEKLSQDEFGKVMKIANDEFLQDQKELVDCSDERYELNADLAESILNQLLKQLQEQLHLIQPSSTFEENNLSKSQNQVFLQTNQTLQTNYHH